MRHLQDLNVLILGLGASGLAMARWCARHGAVVTVADTRPAPAHLEKLQQELPAVAFVGGPFSAALVEGTSIRAVYRSPGLTPAVLSPVVDAARAMGLPVGNELDLFALALADLASPEEEAHAELKQEEIGLPAGTGEVDFQSAEDRTDSASEEQLADEADDSPESEPVQLADVILEADDGDGPSLPVLVPAVVDMEPAGYRPSVLAVTGTNGKTTVTSLTGQLVERAGKSVAVAGNIGPTLLDTLAAHMDAETLPEVWVLELSSFQLDGVEGFEPSAAVVLNLSQDHLDWHGDMNAYAAAKSRVFGNRTFMLLNRDDRLVMDMLPPPVKIRMRPAQEHPHTTFGAGMPQRPGDYGIETGGGMAWLVRATEADETIKRRKDQEVELHIQRLMPVDALHIRGRHNATNALAALALSVAIGCPLGRMLHGLREYRGEPHRVESIAVINEVEYFDDSKGTNVGATAAALSGLGAERKLVLILGGEGKGQDFSPLADPVTRYARAVVLIGRDAPLIRTALEGTGVRLVAASSMPEAVDEAAQLAQPGDAVLMSPACASFDMFDNYEHRAAVFCEAVKSLAMDAGSVV
jgi:UDP-N-acetylmuramoylalanine--D-glutamate ligase